MTPTEQNYGLFELCKQVYEATGWNDTENYYEERFVNGELYALDICKNAGYEDDGKEFSAGGDVVVRNHTPLYTSDYLLEKLPSQLDNNNGESNWLDIYAGDNLWYAMYEYASSEPDGESYTSKSDTPLKALLKLTLKLYEENII